MDPAPTTTTPQSPSPPTNPAAPASSVPPSASDPTTATGYREQHVGDVVHVIFTVPLLTDPAVIQQIGAALERRAHETPKISLLLDFIGVRDISSAFLALLVNLKTLVAQRDGRLKLTNLSSALIEWFKVTRFDHLLEIHTYPHQALSAFKSANRET